MFYGTEIFASELIGKPVVDRMEEPVGTVVDIITLFNDVFPRITGFLVGTVSKGNAVILMGEMDLVGKKFIVTRTPKERIPFSSVKTGDVLLKRDLFDKQIVDTKGARVVRVNDIKIAQAGDALRIIAVDVGTRGFLRRLGIEGALGVWERVVRKKVPEVLIGFNHVQVFKTEAFKDRIVIPHNRIEELHPADIANIISEVHGEEKTAIFASLTDKTAAESLHELEPKIQAFLLTTIDTKKALNILEKMPSDEAADVLGDIPGEKAVELLRLMHRKKAVEVEKLMKHEDETAGGLMTTEFITLPQNLTVEQVIVRLRGTAPAAETIYYLYVVDESDHLAGVLSLRSLIIAPPERPISEIMIKDTIKVSPEMNRKEVAGLISKYNLLAVPVIDKENKILGIITVDDVVDFIVPPLSRRKRQMLG